MRSVGGGDILYIYMRSVGGGDILYIYMRSVGGGDILYIYMRSVGGGVHLFSLCQPGQIWHTIVCKVNGDGCCVGL